MKTIRQLVALCTAFINRSAKAVQWYSLGGWSDDPVELKIGDIRFTLE